MILHSENSGPLYGRIVIFMLSLGVCREFFSNYSAMSKWRWCRCLYRFSRLNVVGGSLISSTTICTSNWAIYLDVFYNLLCFIDEIQVIKRSINNSLHCSRQTCTIEVQKTWRSTSNFQDLSLSYIDTNKCTVKTDVLNMASLRPTRSFS